MADNEVPRRRMGGHELPDHVQDRPEQNAGYDEAVRGRAGDPLWDAAERADEDMDARVSRAREEDDQLTEIDDRAARDAAGEVRRRERNSR